VDYFQRQEQINSIRAKKERTLDESQEKREKNNYEITNKLMLEKGLGSL